MSRIKESEIFFLLKPISSGRWKVSIRSRRVNVRNVAAHFGGGGHDRASGFEISGTPKHCAARIIALIPRGR
jgi:phosphoesterase RecJ-like protein